MRPTTPRQHGGGSSIEAGASGLAWSSLERPFKNLIFILSSSFYNANAIYLFFYGPGGGPAFFLFFFFFFFFLREPPAGFVSTFGSAPLSSFSRERSLEKRFLLIKSRRSFFSWGEPLDLAMRRVSIAISIFIRDKEKAPPGWNKGTLAPGEGLLGTFECRNLPSSDGANSG